MQIYESIIDLIGSTPILHLHKLSEKCDATVAAKLEMFNPISTKDRPVLHMIGEAEKKD